jgi:hypothetical protein
MKRVVFFSLLLMLLIVGTASAQVDMAKLVTGNQASPEAITALRFGQKFVWIFYHAPSIRDPKTNEKRKIFGPGALQADGTIWRLGADYATVLHTDADLDIGGLAVPKGDYTLYAELGKGEWKLIVNKQLIDEKRKRPIWGVLNAKGDSTNDPATELGRTALTMGKSATPVDTLKITLAPVDATHGKLNIAWENMTASVPFTVK